MEKSKQDRPTVVRSGVQERRALACLEEEPETSLHSALYVRMLVASVAWQRVAPRMAGRW